MELRTAHRATREATGCHGWLAAPAPVGGSSSRARGLSSLAAAAVAVEREARWPRSSHHQQQPEDRPPPTTGGGARLREATTTLANRPRAHYGGRENHTGPKIESTRLRGPHITHSGL